jgi:hypothetical protein
VRLLQQQGWIPHYPHLLLLLRRRLPLLLLLQALTVKLLA